MTARAVIFDLDGTLADTLKTITHAMNAGLARLGLPAKKSSEVALLVGEGVSVLCDRALPEDRKSEHAALVSAVRAAYAAAPLHETRLYEGMERSVRELRQLGAKLAVLSNKPHALTAATVTGLRLDDCFEIVLGHKEENPRKPDPTSLLWVLDRLGVRAENSLYVGDTSIDMETARRAGAISVAVSWGFRPLSDSTPFAPDHVAHFPERILAFYRERFLAAGPTLSSS